jgi:hypothetical protein
MKGEEIEGVGGVVGGEGSATRVIKMLAVECEGDDGREEDGEGEERTESLIPFSLKMERKEDDEENCGEIERRDHHNPKDRGSGVDIDEPEFLLR